MNSLLTLRAFRREKTWTTVILLTLALGIGATTALFTIVNALFVRPLPYPQSSRVLSISEATSEGDLGVAAGSSFEAWAQAAHTLASLGAYTTTSGVIRGGTTPTRVKGMLATSGFFRSLGVSPARGRIIGAPDDTLGSPPVVLLSDLLWERLFSRDTTVVGRAVIIDDQSYVVIGIMPRSFTTQREAQYWLPLRLQQTSAQVTFFYDVIGRLAPGVSIDAARRELGAIGKRIDETRAIDQRGRTPVVMSLRDRRFGDARPALRVLFAAVMILLLIAGLNVCNLLLVRGARRHTEFGVRRALGATTWQLMRQVIVESCLLALIGGALGVLVSTVLLNVFLRLAPPIVSEAEGIRPDTAVALFVFALALLTGIIVGLLPALEAVRESGARFRSETAQSTAGPRRHHLGRLLVIAEVSTAAVLLTCAGLLARSFARVLAIDVGFEAEGLAVAELDLPPSRYGGEAAARFFRRLLETIRHRPDIGPIAVADVTPLGGARASFSTRTLDGRESPPIEVVAVSAGYFQTLRTPLLAGRDFRPEDETGRLRVAVINRSLARMLYPSAREALGKALVVPEGPPTEVQIVGIVKDVPQRALESAPHPGVFVPIEQAGWGTHVAVFGRTSDEAAFQRLLLSNSRALDGTIAAPNFTNMDRVLGEAVAARRFSFMLLSMFAALAVTLAGVGLYGILAYQVAERTREIGVRLALGAAPSRLLVRVLRDGLGVTAIGIVLGVMGSLTAAGLLAHMLYGVSLHDPAAFLLAPAVLVLVAVLACWIPARRAARTPPNIALRSL